MGRRKKIKVGRLSRKSPRSRRSRKLGFYNTVYLSQTRATYLGKPKGTPILRLGKADFTAQELIRGRKRQLKNMLGKRGRKSIGRL